ncbi:MAG: endonuclease/exonuclease/phosphatase [Planctomycetota bacterium]|nr:MAG: endonuclease/exonuclease/phosphatase [Planctomycetota bacterium]
MAKQFTKDEWAKIRSELAKGPTRYGLPERTYGSAILGCFNIRKLGRVSRRNAETWQFLAQACRHFDLLAVQEIQDDLAGLRHLTELMGPEFDLIVSDKTGAFPGEAGLSERLGYIFNRRTVRRTEVATDITYDRSKVVSTVYEHNVEIQRAFARCDSDLEAYALKLEDHKSGRRKTKPAKPFVKWPVFVSFIRAPYCVSFEISGHPGTEPYQFMAINAHLYYGKTMADRRQEFDAVMDWIRGRVTENDRAYYPNFVLMGDMNLDFDNPDTDRERIQEHLKSFNDASGKEVNVNFPFLTVHAGRDTVFRTNARLTETFDQIGLFCRDERFPDYTKNATMEPGPDGRGPDYGVFDFVDLFSVALKGKPASRLSKTAKADLIKRFEHKVSDHMPLWLRLPLP